MAVAEERAQIRKVLPLWHPIPAQDLTPFLEGVQQMYGLGEENPRRSEQSGDTADYQATSASCPENLIASR